MPKVAAHGSGGVKVGVCVVTWKLGKQRQGSVHGVRLRFTWGVLFLAGVV